MIVLAWNCRRLGTPLAIHTLTEEVKKQNPVVVFLAETKANTDKMKGSQLKLGFTQGIIVLSDGQNGGLAMLWREGTDIRFKSCLHLHIDVVVHGEGKDGPWRISGFYEHPNTSKRQSSWQLIEALHAQCGIPWVVCGGFNEILHPNEKLGWRERDANQIRNFRDVFSRCGLVDLGFVGKKFTLCNGQHREQHTLLHLNSMVANESWL